METPDRTEYLLALLLLNDMKNVPMREKALQLNLAGFTNIEIANLLQTTSAVVAQSLYESRRRRPRKSKSNQK